MSPRTNEQNQMLREESRARIVTAALTLFSAQGYERTTIKMIAEAAGVAQGLMYHHFASKEALLQAIFQQSLQDVQASFAMAEPTDGRPPSVEAIIRSAFAIMRQRRDFWRLSYGVRMQQSVLETLGSDLYAWIEQIRNTLERALRAAEVADPIVEAALLFAAIDGVAQHYTLDPEGYPLDAVVELMVSRYVH